MLQSIQPDVVLRHCTILDHDNEQVVMRCTFNDCQQLTKWMCLQCKDLHDDHIKECLTLKKLAERIMSIQKKPVFDQREKRVQNIIANLDLQEFLMLQFFAAVRVKLKAWFAALEQEEKDMQKLETRITSQFLESLSDEDINYMLTMNNDDEIKIFQESQENAFTLMNDITTNIDTIRQQHLEKLIKDITHGTVNEKLGQSNFTSVGQYRTGVKVGKWAILNNSGERIGGGKYNQIGNKVGQWIDIEQVSDIYNIPFYAQYIGNYKDGKRIDHWVIKDVEENKIGWGNYNQSGNKEGEWIDIEQCFKYLCQYIGRYNDGTRVDKWEIKDKQGKLIGGGYYNEVGGKIGDWIDIEQCYKYYYCHKGKYHDGLRVDKWQILDQDGKIIGGGCYSQGGIQNGLWIDLEFSYGYYCQHTGNYTNGVKTGKWEIICKDINTLEIQQQHFSGGGNYNESGNKDGQWIDIQLFDYYYIKHIGKYQDGNRIEQWEIFDMEGNSIGGGSYDQQGSKIEEWTDIELSFKYYCKHIGKYQDGKRFGQWKIIDIKGKDIGGGYYNQSGNKYGNWIDNIELCYQYYYQHKGEYNDGKRIGQWLILDKNRKNIGGGSYNNSGNKQGQWSDIKYSYSYYYKHEGQYGDGRRIGQWLILDKEQQIGGGTYNQQGSKDGQWIDLQMSDDYYVQHHGEYHNGKRIGQWEIRSRAESKEGNEQGTRIGGGYYTLSGCKDKLWTDIDLSYDYYYSYIGEYHDGLRIGNWNIYKKVGSKVQNELKMEQEPIGGGYYKQGIKDGKWKDINSSGYVFTNFEGYYDKTGLKNKQQIEEGGDEPQQDQFQIENAENNFLEQKEEKQEQK